jgi:hypothetical protein
MNSSTMTSTDLCMLKAITAAMQNSFHFFSRKKVNEKIMIELAISCRLGKKAAVMSKKQKQKTL